MCHLLSRKTSFSARIKLSARRFSLLVCLLYGLTARATPGAGPQGPPFVMAVPLPLLLHHRKVMKALYTHKAPAQPRRMATLPKNSAPETKQVELQVPYQPCQVTKSRERESSLSENPQQSDT